MPKPSWPTYSGLSPQTVPDVQFCVSSSGSPLFHLCHVESISCQKTESWVRLKLDAGQSRPLVAPYRTVRFARLHASSFVIAHAARGLLFPKLVTHDRLVNVGIISHARSVLGAQVNEVHLNKRQFISVRLVRLGQFEDNSPLQARSRSSL